MTDEAAGAHERIIAGLDDVLRWVRAGDVPGLATEGMRAGGHWNYRLFRHTDPDGEHFYQIHEAYYVDGKVDRWTNEGVTVMGDGARGVLVTLARMTAALAKPTLDYETGEEVGPPVDG